MTLNPENPPAFACVDGVNCYLQEGMTLRDYFAASALRGMLVDPGAPPMPTVKDAWATAAYQFADAMLKARQS